MVDSTEHNISGPAVRKHPGPGTGEVTPMQDQRNPVDVFVDVFCLTELRASVLAAVWKVIPEHVVEAWGAGR